MVGLKFKLVISLHFPRWFLLDLGSNRPGPGRLFVELPCLCGDIPYMIMHLL